MIKKSIITSILSLALVISGITPISATAAQVNNTSGLSLFTRELVSQNNGLNRYQYVDESGETIDFTQDSVSSGTKKRTTSVPASYDARKEQAVTGIKDQGITGSCWAFGALKSLESSSIQKGLTTLEDTDFSENHMAWYAYHGVTDSSNPIYGDENNIDRSYNIYDQGGSPIDSIFVLANWWGAAKEEDAPFAADSESDVAQMTSNMESADESLRTKSTVHFTNANYYDEADLATKKQAIIDNGSMSVALYFSTEDVYEKNGEYSVYQTRYDSDYANHCVTIVGWDDNFSSFRTTPSQGKGAWLIANSYGSDWGNDGYYWVSYYDTSLCEFITYEADAADNYDTNYQYDGAGYESGFIGDKEDIIFSNVFTNTSDSPQKISAAAFYTLTDAQKYEVAIYRNLKSKNPTNGDYVADCTTTGTMAYQGYHTIPLNDSIIVAPGESFSVVTTFFYDKSTIYVPVEGTGSSPNSRTSFSSQTGQSFVYDTDSQSWLDTTKYPASGPRKTTNLNNLCLKAFGSNVSQEEYEKQEETYTASSPTKAPVSNSSGNNDNNSGSSSNSTDTPSQNEKIATTKITPKSKKITMGKGEKVTLSYTVTPSNSTDTFSYTSSKPSVASVNKQGVITGKKKGVAKITISSSSGKTATVNVTVKKAPSSVKVKAGKKTIKKGKTTKIKVTLSKKSASYKITYRSSNKKVATVNSKGVVKGKKKGTVKIKVKTYNGKTGTVKIRVK